MTIQKYEMYHGAVLIGVIRNPEVSLKLIERDKKTHSWGMYGISSNRKDYILFIKSTSKVSERKKEEYFFSLFTFSVDEINKLKNEIKKDKKDILFAMVCHNEHICLLNENDIKDLKILENDNKSCAVYVDWKPHSRLEVRSSCVSFKSKIPRNRLKNFDWENNQYKQESGKK